MIRQTARGLVVASVVGVAVTILGVAFLLLAPTLLEPVFGGVPPGLFGIPAPVIVVVVAFSLAMAGLAWIIRVIRSVDDDRPGPWRFLDH